MIIPEPRFYLKNPTATEPTLISLQAKYEGNRVFMSTGEKIHPDEWDIKLQRAKTNGKKLANGQLNIWLEKIATEFRKVYRDCRIEQVFPEPSLIMRTMQENLNLLPKPKEEVKATLFSFIEKYIEESKALKAPNTVKSYEGTLTHLKKYSQLSCKPFDFVDITIEWRTGFIKYLQGHGFGRNTEGKHIKNIKLFMNEATERGINKNLEFRSKSFQKPVEDVPKIFLNKTEIEKLYQLQLEKNSIEDIVRDYFIISCKTSLRYSDFIDIKQEHIKEDTIQMITKKTGEKVIIPISIMVKCILEKHNYCLPKAPCNQVFNKVLKNVGKLAEINEPISITKTIAGQKQTITYKKYQLLTCHTGRRSMISNGILAGIPHSAIMKISAHKSLKVFQSYVRIDQYQNASVLLGHPFFS